MNNLIRSILPAVFLCTTFLACKKEEYNFDPKPLETANVSFTNMIPGSAPLVLFDESLPVNPTGLSYNQQTGGDSLQYLPFFVGGRLFRVGTGPTYFADSGIAYISVNDFQSVYAYPDKSADGMGVAFYKNDFTITAANSAGFRFLHMGINAPNLNIEIIQNGRVVRLYGNLPFMGNTGVNINGLRSFRTIVAGFTVLRIRATNGVDFVQPIPVTFTDKRYYTVILHGNGTPQFPYSVRFQQNK